MVSLASCVLSFMSPGLAYGRHSHIYLDKSLKATFSKHYTAGEQDSSNEKDVSLNSDGLDLETEDNNDDAAFYETHNGSNMNSGGGYQFDDQRTHVDDPYEHGANSA